MKNHFILACLTYSAIAAVAHAGHEHPERWYQARWCEAQHGQMEYVLPDRTRCDCLTSTHAVEVDFAHKWAEAIGQALYYSSQTGKRAGVLLIMETERDRKYRERLIKTITSFGLPIDIWATKE